MNRVHAEFSRALQIQWPIVDKEALLRWPLGYFQRHAKNRLFRLSRTHVARTEDHQKITAKDESLNAVVDEAQSLDFDIANQILLHSDHLVQHRQRLE